jgi:hypothetical protein
VSAPVSARPRRPYQATLDEQLVPIRDVAAVEIRELRFTPVRVPRPWSLQLPRRRSAAVPPARPCFATDFPRRCSSSQARRNRRYAAMLHAAGRTKRGDRNDGLMASCSTQNGASGPNSTLSTAHRTSGSCAVRNAPSVGAGRGKEARRSYRSADLAHSANTRNAPEREHRSSAPEGRAVAPR